MKEEKLFTIYGFTCNNDGTDPQEFIVTIEARHGIGAAKFCQDELKRVSNGTRRLHVIAVIKDMPFNMRYATS